eukprot:TRINITY_DN2669_c0_g1::TRINITY_DN2669_c0_g1_i1::g.26151::m.26151 TRINITY_DN2669_c0_g1::TRINITY_DN2669_c0_g1_i1::g.26151  ORF type:complete len:1014 (+),score=388.96,sp/Q86KU2/SYVC_DICDI/52.99/0.0,tRNA-synt_1/PF00133.17/1.3e-196,Anticodon_1/PF08264.8/1e-38,tRNA-synt_1g/PF09334.6/6.3e-09,tRNA-synt_1g/PF09334.6/0.16,tRNA-synt_1g/PF09334.6/0.6,tRNA-synt_1g/PF09334.6/1.6e+02,Val_tRNA-synt_C/PF10458.4/8.2e-10,tRNA-synt_1_2/PF13603.1/1.1,tRNA-synt_1_2/PF13603.1/1.7e-06,tRNA-synt_1_2/PF13603.1/4.9e+03,tR
MFFQTITRIRLPCERYLRSTTSIYCQKMFSSAVTRDVKRLPPMTSGYQPKDVENCWGPWWEKNGLFASSTERARQKGRDKTFVMVIPPPNVTGSLHLGHALTVSIEDTISRWHRMKGFEVLWVPGTDHAGIATQVVVEKKLMRERNITRHDLGREPFVSEVWKWKDEFGGRICEQLRHLGASVDWNRECFTMDPKLSKAVTEAFVRMHEKGLIYRSTRLVNWCPVLKTAMSDLEVDYITIDKPIKRTVPGHEANRKYDFGYLTEFAYKVEGSDEEIIVATTRLETMLGDTAVAVHPTDARYTHLHGKFVVHPFSDRKIPIITDGELVDPTFGTGAVKVTPAHDPNDFTCGRRHNLEFITIFDDRGAINEDYPDFKGMMRFDARYHIEKALEKKGLLRGKRENAMRLGVCSRTGDVIEPMLKPQWFVNSKAMAEDAANLVRSGELEIIPAIHKDTWYRWLDNIRDWCISRQLWWGHRIPAYLAKAQGAKEELWVSGRTEDEARAKAAAQLNIPASEIHLEQDPDVLDTWFSSGIFPFSVFGWPDVSDELNTYYPTDLLETGLDILFFWVARMVMMGRTLTGNLPFKRVFLHAMVRDKYGRKMSKSLGNVIDPLEVIYGATLEELHEKVRAGNLDPREVEKAIEGQKLDYPQGIPECGADALRFGLLAYTVQDRDINLDVQRVVGYRNFCNKLWNATKFGLMHIGADFRPVENFEQELEGSLADSISFSDRWILSRLSLVQRVANEKMGAYQFAAVTDAVYFYWYDICDVYLELIKPVMALDESDAKNAARKKAVRNVLYTVLDHGLRLLHPMMPFVTEELYQRLPGRGVFPEATRSIMVAPYPEEVAAWRNEDLEQKMALMHDIVHAARSARAANGLIPKQRPELYVKVRNDQLRGLIDSLSADIATLSLACKVDVLFDQEVPAGCSVNIVNENVDVHWSLKGMVDFSKEVQKLEKQKANLEKQVEGLQKKMTMAGYEEKVPEKVRQSNNEKMASLQQELATVVDTIVKYSALI